jgi:outer membrane lipoprotein-sorting protein
MEEFVPGNVTPAEVNQKMSLRTILAIGLLVTASSVASAAAPKQPANAACSEHVKKMQGMKTSAERSAYCKGNEECSSNHCANLVAHHKTGAKHHASATTTTTPKPATN